MKQQIHAWVDSEIYLEIKIKKINISGLVNRLLKEYIKTENIEKKEVEDIREQLEEQKKVRERASQKITELSVSLAKELEDKKKQVNEMTKNTDDLADSMLKSGDWNG